MRKYLFRGLSLVVTGFVSIKKTPYFCCMQISLTKEQAESVAEDYQELIDNEYYIDGISITVADVYYKVSDMADYIVVVTFDKLIYSWLPVNLIDNFLDKIGEEFDVSNYTD